MGLIVGLEWMWSLLLEVILRGLLLNVCQKTWCWFCGCLNAGVMAFIWNNFVVWHFELAYLLSSTIPQDLSVMAANMFPPPSNWMLYTYIKAIFPSHFRRFYSSRTDLLSCTTPKYLSATWVSSQLESNVLDCQIIHTAWHCEIFLYI